MVHTYNYYYIDIVISIIDHDIHAYACMQFMCMGRVYICLAAYIHIWPHAWYISLYYLIFTCNYILWCMHACMPGLQVWCTHVCMQKLHGAAWGQVHGGAVMHAWASLFDQGSEQFINILPPPIPPNFGNLMQ